MSRTAFGRRAQNDLIGTSVFWLAAAATLVALVICVFWRAERLWLGFAIMLMWSGFSALNAIRCRRVHSIVSMPIYLLAAAAFGLRAASGIDVQNWFIWILACGILVASLSERLLGKYLP